MGIPVGEAIDYITDSNLYAIPFKNSVRINNKAAALKQVYSKNELLAHSRGRGNGTDYFNNSFNESELIDVSNETLLIATAIRNQALANNEDVHSDVKEYFGHEQVSANLEKGQRLLSALKKAANEHTPDTPYADLVLDNPQSPEAQGDRIPGVLIPKLIELKIHTAPILNLDAGPQHVEQNKAAVEPVQPAQAEPQDVRPKQPAQNNQAPEQASPHPPSPSILNEPAPQEGIPHPPQIPKTSVEGIKPKFPEEGAEKVDAKVRQELAAKLQGYINKRQDSGSTRAFRSFFGFVDRDEKTKIARELMQLTKDSDLTREQLNARLIQFENQDKHLSSFWGHSAGELRKIINDTQTALTVERAPSPKPNPLRPH